MPQKVYIVTEVECSDYRTVAVFTSKKEAEEFVNGSPGPKIEEWQTGLPDGVLLYRQSWFVSIDEDGNQQEEASSEWEIADKTLRNEEVLTELAHRKTNRVEGDKAYFSAESYVSEEHALKLVAEARQAWLRAGRPQCPQDCPRCR